MRSELKIGLAVVLSLLALVFGVRFLDGLPLFSGTTRYTLTLDNGDGLAAGNAVALNGVQVGTVESVALDPQTRKVRVRIRVDEGIVLPEGTTVSRGGLSMFGGVRLDLQPGAGRTPVRPGGEIAQGTSSDAFSALAERGPALAARLDTLALGVGLTVGEAYKLLGDEDSDLRSTLRSLRSTSTGLDQTMRTLGPRVGGTVGEAERAALEYRLLAAELRAAAGPIAADARRAAAGAATATARLERTLEGVDGVVEDVRFVTASRRDSLVRLIDQGNATVRTATGILAEGKSVVVRVDSLVALVEAGRGNVGMMLNDSTLYLRLDSAAGSANVLLEDFQKNPGRYLRHLRLFRLF